MNVILTSLLLVSTLLLATLAPAQSEVNIKVIALFSDKALIQVGDQQKVLSKGETFQGITLQSATARGAVVVINGEIQKLKLNRTIRRKFKQRELAHSRIYKDEQGMYFASGKINDKPVRFVVDTGATYVTLSSQLARKIGVDYRRGSEGYANTASATIPVWQVVLDSVSVGDIRVANVMATVIEGSRPSAVLLGNSFLQHTELQRIGSVMELQQRY